MRRFLAVLAAVVLIPAAIYAGWEALMLELTNPADGDLISVQDVSDKTKSAAGTTKHLLLSDLWGEYLDTKVAAWLGIDPTTLTADYFIKVKSAGGGLEESQTLSVDISGFSPSMALYSDVQGLAQSHPTVSAQELAMLDGYNVSAGTIEERFSAISAGTPTIDITVGGETANVIAATLQVEKNGSPYSENASIRTWLSATDGGAPGSAYDGNSGDAWVISDATVMTTHSANYDETVLTGADGDCVVTMAHSDASSPATKYLCTNYKDTISCAEVTFSADATPCSANSDLSQTLDEYEWTSAYGSYLSQKIDGSLIPTGTWKVCKVVAVMRRGSTGTNPDVHLEFWTEGSSNAGRQMTTAQVDGDSDTEILSSSSDMTIEFTWTSNNPEITGGTNYFLHRVTENDGEAPAYWIGTQNENSFSDTNFDAFGPSATDLSGDFYFVIYLESAS